MLETGSQGLWQSYQSELLGLGLREGQEDRESQGSRGLLAARASESFAHFSPTATQKAPASPQMKGSRMTPPKSYSLNQGFLVL